ncbi:MAG: hypothetical protein U1B80_09900 [Anaerolineaceae bacterium]|nr:hypothetical protein [Anaerolineaceae bacterium]
MRPIRASEIGSYLYCKRAWWYQLKGEPSENQAEMVTGSSFHRRHGRLYLLVTLQRLFAWLLLLLAVALVAVGLTLEFLP